MAITLSVYSFIPTSRHTSPTLLTTYISVHNPADAVTGFELHQDRLEHISQMQITILHSSINMFKASDASHPQIPIIIGNVLLCDAGTFLVCAYKSGPSSWLLDSRYGSSCNYVNMLVKNNIFSDELHSLSCSIELNCDWKMIGSKGRLSFPPCVCKQDWDLSFILETFTMGALHDMNNKDMRVRFRIHDTQ